MKTTRREFLAAVWGSSLLAPVVGFAEINWHGKLRVTNGPMLGMVTPDKALVWARVGGEHAISLEVTDEKGVARMGPEVRSLASEDYCVKLESPKLEANSTYRYRIFIDGDEDDYLKDQFPCYLKTAPAKASSFKVAFGSCAKFQDDPVQEIWRGVEEIDPDLFFWLGDNVYIDSLHESVMAECYRTQRDILTAQRGLRNTPQLAIWDDHDFCLNDHDRRNPAKETALKVFKRYWANPSYGQDDNPGVYFTYNYGGIDFFFVDGRYYRDPNDQPDSESKTMLGAKQLAWLKAALKASDTPFKVLVSGSGFSVSDGPVGDTWSSRLHERNDLFDYIADENISGIVMISGDTHVGELNCIPWSENGGYDFFELVSSPLAQKPQKGDWTARHPEIRIRQVYFRSTNVGLLDFNLDLADPTLTMTLHDPGGLQNWWDPVTIKASELVNGHSSWRDHIDEISLVRHESMMSGGPYYVADPDD